MTFELRSLAARAAALLCAGTCALASPAYATPVSENDVGRLVGLSSPAISPEGKWAVVIVKTVVWEDDKTTSDLVAVDLTGGATKTLLHDRGDLSDPAYSPDGTQLAFIATDGKGEDAHDQVFMMPAQGGEIAAVTHSGADVDAFAWRRDGRAVAYTAADAKPATAGADRFRDSFVFTTEPIVARRSPQPLHLFVQPLEGGAATQLTFGTQSVAGGDSISWSPDGTSIAFTLSPNAILNDQNYSRVAVVDIAGKTVRPLTGRAMWEGTARFSPDGAHVAYLYSDGDPQVNLTHLFVTTPSGRAGSAISVALDRPVGDYVWSHDSQSLVATAPDGTTNGLYRISLGGEVQRLDTGGAVPGTPLSTTGGADAPSLGSALGSDGTLVFLATLTKDPIELYKRSNDGTTAKVSGFNDASASLPWANAQRVTFPTSTGVEGDGVLYLPPGFSASKKYPLVVFIHGGPDDPSMLEFDFWAQVMAARGWLVLRPNYRGSPNLGRRYQRAILYDPEDGPGKDIVSAVDAVRARGSVDPARIAVCGWSYGGIMTAWLISKYHFWRVAVSGASVNDWITDYGTADDSVADADLFHGSPFVGGGAAEWRRASAISYAAGVTTPVLVLSDVGDNRDPFATSSMYWRALRDNHKDATLRVWPINGHFPTDPVRIADVFHYWIDYIAEHF